MGNATLHYAMYYGTDGGKAQAWCGRFVARGELWSSGSDDDRLCRACQAAIDGTVTEILAPITEESKP